MNGMSWLLNMKFRERKLDGRLILTAKTLLNFPFYPGSSLFSGLRAQRKIP